MNHLCKTLLGGALLLGGLTAKAQGLEGIIVEDYYTVTAADADYLNNTAGVTYPITTGTKVYRIYVDMAPGYKLNTVNGSPETFPGSGVSPNPLDFTTTTTFWNEDGFGSEVPPQTARFDDGAAFDSYITIGLSGRSGGAVGCGANTQQAGVLKTADANGNLTLCSVYSGFPSGAGTPDGNAPPAATIPALTYNLGGLIDFAALQADGNQLVVIGDAWATLPNGPGQDPTGTNRQLIAQLTTDGDLSFHINVQLQTPDNSALETYVWNQAGSGEVVSPFLTYPSAGTPDCLGVIGGPAVPGTACNDNNACTINDLWDANCVCAGTIQDTDGDGTCDANDGCPNDANKIAPGVCGCGVADVATTYYADADGDGFGDPNNSQAGFTCNVPNGFVANNTDLCPADVNKQAPGACGCGIADTDTDSDGTANCNDGCPADSNKIAPGICGCGVADTDTDGDGTANCNDGCPADPNKIAPGICGCGVADTDTDGDGTANCNDGCPADPNKTAPGTCGCGVADTDGDGDGIADCVDNCPAIAGQIGSLCDDGNNQTTGDVIGANCVCAGSTVDCNDNDPCTIDTFNGTVCVNSPAPDTDGDGTCDLTDGCPADANKIAPGICGCGVADTDGDGDGTADCNDGCPTDPNKTAPGTCGCGVADIDGDGDGLADCVDNCPGIAGQIGSPCDDGNNQTTGDVTGANCVCAGSTVDCNDNDPCTIDTFNGTVCVNTPAPDTDGDGTCDLTDGCPADANKIAPGICGCGNQEPGAACDDNNAGTVGDVIDASCQCVGTPLGVDCLGVPGGSALPGTACDDQNANTGGDVWSAGCVCAGLPFDCEGVAGGTATIGSACSDGDVCTTGDVYDANCDCVGTFQDTDGDGVCNASDNCPNVTGQIGSTCDDGNVNTTGDVLNANCQCQGIPVGGCTENLTLALTLDNFGSQTTWTLYDESEVVVVDQGGPYSDGTPGVVSEAICVPVGCYHLVVNDAAGDGISGGGYVLSDATGKRIIDASLGSFSSTSEINTGNNPNRSFCVPVSNYKLLNNWCDRSSLLVQSPIYCNSQPGASGYQFWIFDPHGSYNRRVLLPNPTLVPASLLTNPVPVNVDLNVRVRVLVNGVYSAFGPACRARFRPNNPNNFRDMEYTWVSTPTMTLFPNPNRDGMVTLNMEGLAIENEVKVDVEIYDMLGQRVHAEQAIAAEGLLNHRMDLSDVIGSGLYMVNVTINGELFTQRLVKQ